jgi:hypothetical protein
MFKNKKILIFALLLSGLVFFWQIDSSRTSKPANSAGTNTAAQITSRPSKKITYIKYRSDPVDLNSAHFEYFPTSSSFVNGLWYDQSNQYMIILLNDTYYHYCGLPATEWKNFKNADSYGTYYNQRIKGNYDCRTGYVPSY